MKYKEPRAMKEIHDIRIALYEEKRRLSTKEKVHLTNRTAKNSLRTTT